MEWNGKYLKYAEEAGIAIVTLANPPVNALCRGLFSELAALFTKIEVNKALGVVILTGEGTKAFTAGADIEELAQLEFPEGGSHFQNIQDVFNLIENFPLPVIGCVNGFALGAGFELLLTTDIRIACKEARVGATGVNLGLCFNTQRLPRLIGINLAKEMIFTGAQVSALKARNLGIINRVVTREELMPYTIKLAKKIMSKAPLAVKAAKLAINRGMQMTLEEGLKLENQQMSKMFNTKDRQEGIKAFLDKRLPEFKGE
jgi:enoyl-CoA hydratase/carnithine racemase